MKHVDVKSFLIGVLFTLLVFVSIGADEGKPTDGNLGDIVVNSITIKDDGHGGFITAYNQDQKRTLYLGTGKDENGYVQTFINDLRDILRYDKSSNYITSSLVATENTKVVNP